MTDLHKYIVGQLNRALKASARSIGEVMKTAGLTHQWWNKFQKGQSPTLRSLEALSDSLGMVVAVDIMPASTGKAVGVNTDILSVEDALTDEVLQLARMLDEIPEGDARRTAIGAVQGIVTMARATARPPVPAGAGGLRHRTSKSR